jgi:hypothetical protein
MRKCECDRDANVPKDIESMYDPIKELPYANHKAGKCKCTNNIREYIRGGKKVYLCSCCC